MEAVKHEADSEGNPCSCCLDVIAPEPELEVQESIIEAALEALPETKEE